MKQISIAIGTCLAISCTLLFFQNCSIPVTSQDSSPATNLVNMNASALDKLRKSAQHTSNVSGRKVGMIYMVWHCMANNPTRNKVIEQALKDGQWGAIPDFHWRNVPLLTGNISSYCTQDKALVEKHFQLLEAAQIDYLVVDFTNQFNTPGAADGVAPQSMLDSFQNLLDVSTARGGKIKVVPWVSFQGNLYDRLMQMLKARPAAQFIFDDKPLIIASWGLGQQQVQAAIQAASKQGFTVRKMWGLLGGKGASDVWSFMEPCQNGFRESQGDAPCLQSVHPEMASVSAAYQLSYMTDFNSSVPKFQGRTFLRQLETAQQGGSQLILINTWNEWMAQRFCMRDGAATHECYQNGQVSQPLGNHFPFDGRPVFVDMFSREYSRDFEPDQGSSDYYNLLLSSVAAFKATSVQAAPAVPLPVVAPTPNVVAPVTPGGYSDIRNVTAAVGGVPGQTGDWWCELHFGTNIGGRWECLSGGSCANTAYAGQVFQCGRIQFSSIQSLRASVGGVAGQTGNWWCNANFGVNLGGRWECLGGRCREPAVVNQTIECGRR